MKATSTTAKTAVSAPDTSTTTSTIATKSDVPAGSGIAEAIQRAIDLCDPLPCTAARIDDSQYRRVSALGGPLSVACAPLDALADELEASGRYDFSDQRHRVGRSDDGRPTIACNRIGDGGIGERLAFLVERLDPSEAELHIDYDGCMGGDSSCLTLDDGSEVGTYETLGDLSISTHILDGRYYVEFDFDPEAYVTETARTSAQRVLSAYARALA